MVVTKKVSLETRGNGDTQDITREVARAVGESGVRSGVVTLFCPGSTSALTTIEYEPGAVADLQQVFEEMVPSDRYYRHNERWGDGNGHSHVRAALLGPSLAVPFVDGVLTLGTWQQIVHIDFDVRPRQREVIAQIVGE
ncbi:MAG: secondary thiamine-phosphate synthase enzyme YjbQ [Dehalococcoidia bacterium]|jgi:secondary thiamine-phosphate synthase enzyme